MTKEEYKQAQRELQQEEIRENQKSLFVHLPLMFVAVYVICSIFGI